MMLYLILIDKINIFLPKNAINLLDIILYLKLQLKLILIN